jgi:hypothetical protein
MLECLGVHTGQNKRYDAQTFFLTHDYGLQSRLK